MKISATQHLEYARPFNWSSILGFLARRVTPGVETISQNTYSRSFRLGQHCGYFEVSHDPDRDCLLVNINVPNQDLIPAVLERIRSLFDLNFNPDIMLATLGKDEKLWSRVELNPGLRKPGSWDGIEIAVRAITGQQISVDGATTVMGKIAYMFGEQTPVGFPVSHFFPTPQALAELDPQALPMPQARARTIRSVSKAITDGKLALESNLNTQFLIDQLLAIKGIGPWTAQYIAMRALADADALLEGDLVLENAAGHLYGDGQRMPTRELVELAEQWRPYRAYASLHLWEYSAGIK